MENSAPTPEWPRPSRERCAEAYASGASLQELSLEFEVSISSVRRWLRTPEAQRIISEVRQGICGSITGRMIRRSAKAGRRLDQLRRSSDERVALGASKAIFDVTLKLRAFEEFDRRLRFLEENAGLGLGKDEPAATT